jgi:DNA repair protein SbcC/Rad50
MIINSLKLDPFAGISKKQIDLEKGLNVIVGPNEAGKSTLLNALRLVLFVPTDCGKRIFKEEIADFMPLAGGDTIRVGLDFRIGKHDYSVTKSWGYSKQDSELKLPGGGLKTNAQDVQEELQNLLVLSRGTSDSVLFGAQSRLGHTYDSLEEGSSAMQDLASIMRKTIFETEGVSIGQLGDAIDDSFYDYFSHWDTELKRPEGNRQIDNPWKKEVRKILTAYYKLERLKQQMLDVQEHEDKIGELVQLVQERSTELQELQAYLKENQKAVTDAKQRQILVAQHDALRIKEKTLLDASKLWPTIVGERNRMQNDLRKFKTKHRNLEKEMDKAQAYEDNKARLEKYKRASRKKNELERKQNALLKMKVIEEKDYKKLEKLNAELMKLETSLQAGQLALTMTAKKALSLRVSKDFEKETQHRLGARRSLKLSAGGQVQIDHDDWALKVKSGDIDFDDLKKSVEDVSSRYEALLRRLCVSDFDSAGKAYDSYQIQRNLVTGLQERLEEILDGETYEELDKLARKASRTKAPSRTSGSIGKELGAIVNEISNTENEIKSRTQTLSGLERKYGSQDELLELLVNERAELKRTEMELKKLKPLPKSVEGPDQFILEYEKKQIAAQKEEREINGLRIEKAHKEAQAPTETREELQSQLIQAELDFAKREREGEAISEIRDTFRKIEAEMDSQTLDPWLDELGTVLEPLTANRYKQIDLGEGDSGKALRADGLAIPFVLLSIGTKVGLGLALRLSMARYFLKDSEGFLVLDDPLVDMDPDRQGAAAKIIQNFAAEKQVIVMTCHPSHADLLAGNTIRLLL